MCSGIAIAYRLLSDRIAAFPDVAERVVTPAEGAEKEVRFFLRDRIAVLPVLEGGQLSLVEWGNRDRRSRVLPRTFWCRQESIEKGVWAELRPEQVDIPATALFEKGVWLHVKEGLRGVLVKDEHARPHVFILTEPASHYYEVATRHDRMPVLIGERI